MKFIATLVLLLLCTSTSFADQIDAARIVGDLKLTGIHFSGDSSTIYSSKGLVYNKGAWTAGVAYSAGDVVQSGGVSYVCSSANTDAPPPNANWTLLAAQGLQGIQGIQGIQGTTGSNGFNSLILMTDEASGSNCTNGGIKIQVGLDSSRNGVLDSNEVSQTKYVCSGAAPVITTVTDPSTSLMWQKADDNVKRNWFNATTYCSGLNLGGYSSGWRLPTRVELLALNLSSIYSQIQGTHFADLGGGNYAGSYWTSTSAGGNNAYHIFLSTSQSEGYADKTGWTNLVRCVRP